MPEICRSRLQISMQTQNMGFQKNSKNFKRKCAPIFSKVGSKESQENTEDKVGLRQADILKF
jgi:hypothetical protein